MTFVRLSRKGSSYRAQKEKRERQHLKKMSTTAAGVASRKLSVGLPLAYFGQRVAPCTACAGSPLAGFFAPFWQGSPLAGWLLLLWYYFISFFSADSLLSSTVVKVWCSAAKRWTKSRACSLAVLLANLPPIHLPSSKVILAMGCPSMRIPAMKAAAFALLANLPILLAPPSGFVLLKLPPAGSAGGTIS